jgi:hypothetical protein
MPAQHRWTIGRRGPERISTLSTSELLRQLRGNDARRRRNDQLVVVPIADNSPRVPRTVRRFGRRSIRTPSPLRTFMQRDGDVLSRMSLGCGPRVWQ